MPVSHDDDSSVEEVPTRDNLSGSETPQDPSPSEEQTLREDVRLLEHWSLSKASARDTALNEALQAERDAILQETGAYGFGFKEQGDLPDTFITGTSREQLKYYKEVDSHKEQFSPPKTRVVRKAQNAAVMLRIERELEAEVRSCKLRSQLHRLKAERRTLLSTNSGLVPEIRDLKDVLPDNPHTRTT